MNSRKPETPEEIDKTRHVKKLRKSEDCVRELDTIMSIQKLAIGSPDEGTVSKYNEALNRLNDLLGEAVDFGMYEVDGKFGVVFPRDKFVAHIPEYLFQLKKYVRNSIRVS